MINSHALGARESDLRLPVNECASPKFQREQAPELARVVPHAAPVFIQYRQDRPVIEFAAFTRETVVQRVVKHLAQFAVEPSADRNVEAMLGPVDNLFRDQPLGGPFENVLGLLPAELQ